MKNYIRILAVFIAVVMAISLVGCRKGKGNDNPADNDAASSVIGEVSAEDAAKGMDITFTERERDPEKSLSEAQSLSDKRVTVKKEGTYVLSGKYDSVTVETADTEKVQLILDNVDISNDSGPAIYIKESDKVFITLKDGTENRVSDGETYKRFTGDEENIDAAIFSRADLCINGGGSLSVNGNYKSGIVSKDDLVITGGKIIVESKGCAIEGKDCVKTQNCDITVSSGGDGIRSTNSEDASRGYVYIESGNYNITSTNDSFQAQTVLKIENGDFTLKTGGGSANSSHSNPDWGNWGGFHGDGRWQENSTEDSAESAKALKAGTLIFVAGGNFGIDSSDDSIHSNGDIEFKGGTVNASSGDDGMHADSSLIINGGEINIAKSYEGIEATKITVNSGNIDVTASDDGFNAAGGNDGSALGGRPGQNPFEGSSDAFIAINGGYIHVNASGDGIDSNGSVSVTAGVMLVSGPENGGNGAFDYGISATVSGGVAILTGSTGMAQGFSSSSSQCSLLYNGKSFEGDTSVAITDKSGNVLASFTPEKKYASIVMSCSGMKNGESYKLVFGGNISGADKNGFAESGRVTGATDETEIELTSVSTSYGSGGMDGGMGGGMGGHGRPGRYF